MHVLLFTDIASSTRLWEQHPNEMRTALARHDDILRGRIVAWSGEVIKSTGDGLLATFDSVAACVAACIDMQRSLAGAGWELPEPLRVRMGVHVGDAERRGTDLYGTAVNRAARITAAGHGGQVLLSSRAAETALDALPPGVELRDLGAHRLKDLAQPEHLFQLVHPDLEERFPPLATIDARPNNLPVQVSEFVGREAELANVVALLRDRRVRLITLTGAGGSGKTRLGLQAAAEVIDDYRDGVFFVDLAAVREADTAFETILRDLGLSSARQGSPMDVLKARLRDRTLLLVLDNFEQVTAAAVGIAELLAHCPRLEVLVTSRQALRLRGEHVVPVPPLSLPDPRAPLDVIAGAEAVRLFVDRARSVRPDFGLDPEVAAAVAEITRRLDGLPLAIELAAARVRMFSPRDLLERLRSRPDALGSGARDLPARQRTLRSTIEWSFDLLEPEERRLFEAFSVFSTARLESVEAVAAEIDPDLDVLDVLASLVDKSLIRSGEVAGSQRFSMLQTVRDFAAERLAGQPEVEATARRAHAVHYCDFAAARGPGLDGPGRERALTALADELANLRLAWRFWVDARDRRRLERLVDLLWALFEARGWYHAVGELARDMLALPPEGPPSIERDLDEATLRASLARAMLAVDGYTVAVEGEFQRALALAEAPGGGVRRYPILRALATYFMNIADHARAADIGRQLLEIAEAEGDERMLLEGHVVYGLNVAFGRDPVEGLRHLDEAIARFDPERHGSGRFHIGTSRGVVARIASGLLLRSRGSPDEGARRVADALELARRLDHPFTLAYALYHAGFMEITRQRLEPARARATELAAVASDQGYPVWQALASVLEGVALCGMGAAEEGVALTQVGADLYSGLTTPPIFWPPLLALRATGLALADRLPQALELVDEAIAAAGDEPGAYPEFRILRGDILAALPDPDLALAEAAYRAAVAGAHTFDNRLTELAARAALTRLLVSRGTGDEERSRLESLYATFTEGFDEPELVAARSVLALDPGRSPGDG